MKKDISTKHIIKNLAIDISRYILNLDISDNITLIDKEFDRVEKRETDILFSHKDEIIHIEIQNNNQSIFPYRMLRYFVDIKSEFLDKKVKQYAIYIGKEKCIIKDKLSLDII